MSEYGELPPNDGSEEVSQLTGEYDIENGEKKEKKKTYNRKKLCALTFCSFFIPLVLYIAYVCYPLISVIPDENLDDYNYTQDIVESTSPEELYAAFGHGMHRGIYYRRKSCLDLDYGCCEISLKCSDKGSYLDYTSYKLSMYRITPNDRIKSNCPSLDTVIHKWNQHYKKGDCENSKFGCCPAINTACDFSLKNKRENNEETVELYQQNIHRSHKLKMAKNDEKGSNCPGKYNIYSPEPINDIVDDYNHGYPNHENHGWEIVRGVLLVLFLFAVCWAIDNC